MANGEDWGRLRDYVISRRRQAGIPTRREMSRMSGLAYRTLAQVESAKSVNANTLASIETVLGWKPGSARRILAGGEPDLVQGSAPESDSRPEAIRDILSPEDWDDDRVRELWSLETMPLDTKRGLIIFYLRGKENAREAEVRPFRQAR